MSISAVKKVKDRGMLIGFSATYGEITKVFNSRGPAEHFERYGPPQPEPEPTLLQRILRGL